MQIENITIRTKRMIDDLKTICANFGLGGSPGEYKIITQVFLYCSIGRGLAALNSKIGSQLYLWYTLAGFKQLFNVLDGNGTTFGSITKDTLYETKVVIPNPVLVKSFEEIVQPIEQKIRIIEEENRELTKLRDWLLPMLMNGQATVE